jgi:hypothetical protein
MRKKYKNEIFNFLNSIKLGTENFDIEERIEDDIQETNIVYTGTQLEFKIRTSNASYELLDYRYVKFSPTYDITDFYPPKGWTDFKTVFESFKFWINNHVNEYVEELQIPDLWSAYKNGNKSFRFEEMDFEDQDKFRVEEKEQIEMSINELKLLIHKNLETSDEEQQLVNNRLDYLIEAMNRLNKFDWKSVAISTIMSISIALSLDTSKGQILFELFKKIFSIIPMLIE